MTGWQTVSQGSAFMTTDQLRAMSHFAERQAAAFHPIFVVAILATNLALGPCLSTSEEVQADAPRGILFVDGALLDTSQLETEMLATLASGEAMTFTVAQHDVDFLQ